MLWIAHGLGMLVAGFWMFSGLMATIAGADPWTAESTVLAIPIVARVLAVAAVWWRTAFGGMLLLLVGVAPCVFAWVAAGHNKLFAVGITGVRFLLVAFG